MHGFLIPDSLDTRFMILRWLPPKFVLKGNVDGSSTSFSSSGGGIVRNNAGKVVLAFSFYYGSITNNEAEMRAIWDLIEVCGDAGVILSYMESDSENVIQMLTGKMSVQWKCSKWCKRIQRHTSFHTISFSHCYRETNFPADFLAKHGGDNRVDNVYRSFLDLPRDLHGLCNLDRWGIPAIRQRKTKFEYDF